MKDMIEDENIWKVSVMLIVCKESFFFGNEGNLLNLVLGQVSGQLGVSYRQLLEEANARPGGSGCPI